MSTTGVRNMAFTGVAACMLLCSMGYYASKPDTEGQLLSNIQGRRQVATRPVAAPTSSREIRKTKVSEVPAPVGDPAKMRRVAAFLILMPFLSHVDKG